MNLVTNAYHAMADEGGILDIVLQKVKKGDQVLLDQKIKPGNYVCLMIRDNGRGIDPGIRDKIFDPYFSTKNQGKGSGVGLSVVHGIVDSHDGYIHVESASTGTRFDIYFPKCQRYTDIELEQQEDLPIEKGSESILLVDDDEKVAIMQTQMLEKLGYTVTCCIDSLEAIDFFENNPDRFDAVVTDLTMPDLSGIQLAARIYDIKPKIPIILCSGLGDTIERKKFDSLSIKGFLKKPVAVKELSHMLRQVMDEG